MPPFPSLSFHLSVTLTVLLFFIIIFAFTCLPVLSFEADMSQSETDIVKLNSHVSDINCVCAFAENGPVLEMTHAEMPSEFTI